VRDVVMSVRRFYPRETFILVSDGGPDFTELASEYRLQYFYDAPLCSGPTCSRSLCFNSAEVAHAYMSRVHQRSSSCASDWVTILEADVKMVRRYRGMPPHAANGFLDHNGPQPEALRSYVELRNGHTPARFDGWAWGLSGGAVFSTSLLRSITAASLEAVKALCDIDSRARCNDVLFTALVWLHNETAGPWHEICGDCRHANCDAEPFNVNCTTWHGHKRHYGGGR